MSRTSQDHWQTLWQSSRASGDPAAWYRKLSEAYAEPQRHYHNLQHIAECLVEFDHARHLAKEPAAVEWALWFHDAVYDPKAADNEERSAALAQDCFASAAIPQLAKTVGDLVMATKLHGTQASPDTALIVDIDLSILGKDLGRFAGYEAQIREEYIWVPETVFAAKRAEILQRFLSRTSIYATEYFRNRYEESARHNLHHSIQQLLSRC